MDSSNEGSIHDEEKTCIRCKCSNCNEDRETRYIILAQNEAILKALNNLSANEETNANVTQSHPGARIPSKEEKTEIHFIRSRTDFENIVKDIDLKEKMTLLARKFIDVKSLKTSMTNFLRLAFDKNFVKEINVSGYSMNGASWRKPSVIGIKNSPLQEFLKDYLAEMHQLDENKVLFYLKKSVTKLRRQAVYLTTRDKFKDRYQKNKANTIPINGHDKRKRSFLPNSTKRAICQYKQDNPTAHDSDVHKYATSTLSCDVALRTVRMLLKESATWLNAPDETAQGLPVKFTVGTKRAICQFKKDNPCAKNKDVQTYAATHLKALLSESSIRAICQHPEKWLTAPLSLDGAYYVPPHMYTSPWK